jgi:biopolymer transport protein ExbD
VPLQIPISLAQGHIRTAEFKINLEVFYELYIEFEPVFGDGSVAGVHCPTPRPRTVWFLSKGGQVVANGNGGGGEHMGGVFGSFYADAGRYTLDFEVLDNGTCLNAGSPRLTIETFRDRHPEVDDNVTNAFFLGLLLAFTGINLFVHSYRARRQQEPACPLTEPGPQSPLIDGRSSVPTNSRAVASKYDRLKLRRPYVWPFQKPGWFGLIAFSVYSVLLIIDLLVRTRTLFPTGLAVHLLRPEVAVETQPGVEPLLVRVEGEGFSAVRSLYIGSWRVPSQDFDTVLRKGLDTRPPSWPVYVEGDPDLEWRAVVKVIEEIRGFNVKVVLLTRPRK